MNKISFIEDDGGRCAEYGIKPLKKNQIGDCVIRAIAIALDQSYKRTLKDLCEMSIADGGVPNDEFIYERYLSLKGWVKNKPPRDVRGRKIKIKDWNPPPRAIVLTTGHLTAVVNDCVRDNGDTREWCCNSFYTKEAG